MKKPKNRIILFSILLCSVLGIAYQNCGQIDPEITEETQNTPESLNLLESKSDGKATDTSEENIAAPAPAPTAAPKPCPKVIPANMKCYSVSGKLYGLSGGTVVLANNGVNPLSLTVNGAFTFTQLLQTGSGYNVTVNTQPVGQTCTVYFGTGVIAYANITNVVVKCVPQNISVYVTDSWNGRIQKFNSQGNYISQFSSFGSSNGQINVGSIPFFQGGLTVDSAGNLYIADTNNHRMQKFNSQGNYILQWGTYGTGINQFHWPETITFDSANNGYVADTSNRRIQKFDSQGNYILGWGSFGYGNGQFNSPSGIAVDTLGNVYVAEIQNRRIQKFNSQGTYILQWGSSGTGNGQFNQPMGIARDSTNNIYVVDSDNHRIQKFNSQGSYITQWGSLGTGNGQFNKPQGIAIDGSNNVYVTDTQNHRIQKFNSQGSYITQWGSLGTGNAQFDHPSGIAVAQ